MRLYSLPKTPPILRRPTHRAGIRSDRTARGSSGHRPAGHRSPRHRPAGNARTELFLEHRRSAPEMPAKITAAWFRVAGEGTVRAVSWLWRRGRQFGVRFLSNAPRALTSAFRLAPRSRSGTMFADPRRTSAGAAADPCPRPHWDTPPRPRRPRGAVRTQWLHNRIAQLRDFTHPQRIETWRCICLTA